MFTPYYLMLFSCCSHVLSIYAPGIIHLVYEYDNAGNMLSKTDHITSQKTSYGYDKKDRLTSWNIKAPVPLPLDGPGNRTRINPPVFVDTTFTMTYDGVTGNICTKSDLGANATYSYTPTAKPHALRGISGVDDDCLTGSVAVTYTDKGKVKTVSLGSGASYAVSYAAQGGRGKSVLTVGNHTQTRYYGDRTEKIYDSLGGSQYLLYLCHGAIAVRDISGSPTVTVLQGYYDAQGSLTALVSSSGTVVHCYAYDPWGNRMDPDDWTQPDTRTDTCYINRGYTMHEHLDDFGLINMNGRVFDPATAQFLSPDDYIQEDGNWLNYNRYAYCLNNPLKYTDPSGDLAITATTLFIAGMSSGLINMGMHIDDSQNAGKYFAIGAISYLASGAIGAAAGFSIGSIVTNIGAGAVITGIAAGAVGGAAGGAAGGFILGYGNSRIGGVNFVKSLQNGVSSAERNATYNAVFDAVVGTISGLNNDVYCEVEIQETRDFSSEEIAMMKQRAITYHSSDISNNDSEYLQYRVQKVYHLSETENGIDISSITTKFDVGTYGLTTNGYYYKYANNTIVGGYIVHGKHPTIVHISPAVTYANDVHFKAVVGHELIHAYHNYSIPNFSTYFSERVAYQYSFREYLNNGNFQEANELKKMIRGAYPLYYYINPYFLHLY